MAYRTPTSRKSKRQNERINLIPILDAVFIFIFFLLMSTQFIKIYEISSDVPIISNSPPPKKQKKLLNLTVTIKKNRLVVTHDLPRKASRTIKKGSDGEYNLVGLHEYLLTLKEKYVKEELVILMPEFDLTYEEIVKIMDSIRLLKNTDGTLFKEDKDGINVQVKTLFSKIIFGNIMS